MESDRSVDDTVVIIDDELHNVVWMADFLEDAGSYVLFASNVNEGIHHIEEAIYRALIIDLNIPVLSPYDGSVSELGSVYKRFPGLFLARRARELGYPPERVVIYSVHRDADVVQEARNIDCEYIIKGRPREIKEKLTELLSDD